MAGVAKKPRRIPRNLLVQEETHYGSSRLSRGGVGGAARLPVHLVEVPRNAVKARHSLLHLIVIGTALHKGPEELVAA